MLKIKGLVLCLFFILSVNIVKTQFNDFEFIPPLEIPIFLSGNFAEIRSDHFHTGIDIKTKGESGHKVLAIADGYISRIKIQANGYGKALYVTHSNGYTSVFCHLDRFNDEIWSYVINEQYKRKSFEIDLNLDKETFIVRKGDIIGFSGNSGGSFGPHLHFEIRNQEQEPLNVLKFNINIKDDIAPVIKSLMIYPFENAQVNNSHEEIMIKALKNNGYYITQMPEIPISGKIGIGIETYDYLNGSNNQCGIYSIELEIDSHLVNQFIIDKINFNQLRYVNAHIDYKRKFSDNIEIHKLFRLPNNKLDIYNFASFDGLIDINDTLKHLVTIYVRDANNNLSRLKFVIRGSEKQLLVQSNISQHQEKIMNYNQTNSFLLNDIKIIIPENALYDDINFQYAKTDSDSRFESPVYYIHNEYTPLHKNIILSIQPIPFFKKNLSKTCLAYLNKKNEPEFAGGILKNGFIETETNKFGRYIFFIDTLPPKILPVNFVNNTSLQNINNIIIQVKDDFSGIQNYSGFIDNEWALFDYDKKNDIITYTFDEKRIEKNKWHQLLIVSTDKMNNKSEKQFRFFW